MNKGKVKLELSIQTIAPFLAMETVMASDEGEIQTEIV